MTKNKKTENFVILKVIQTLKTGIIVILFSFSNSSLAQNKCLKVLSLSNEKLEFLGSSMPPDFWLKQESRIATEKILKNISRDDGLPGAIVAALTRANPNYYHHWVRDAGIVVEALISRYKELSLEGDDSTINERDLIEKRIFEYIDFSKIIQSVPTQSGNGEPLFEITGHAFNDAWGRPQTDGPASRAISMMKIIDLLNSVNKFDSIRIKKVTSDLYDGKLPTKSCIKIDLEYIAHNWNRQTYDLWEEVNGIHFYTLMVQRKALLEGANLADRLFDPKAAIYYRSQVVEIEKSLVNDFYDPSRKIYIATKPGSIIGGINKEGFADIAVILGLIYGGRNDGFIPFSSSTVINTMEYLENYFKKAYPINNISGIPGIAIGRYQFDMFSGPDRSGGNPWVLATLAMAEAYYHLAFEIKNGLSKKDNGFIKDYRELVSKGDSFVARVQYHTSKSGDLSEQIQRDTGFATSVADLSWSYAFILSAKAARDSVFSENTSLFGQSK